jgi:hypothetical protein
MEFSLVYPSIRIIYITELRYFKTIFAILSVTSFVGQRLCVFVVIVGGYCGERKLCCPKQSDGQSIIIPNNGT